MGISPLSLKYTKMTARLAKNNALKAIHDTVELEEIDDATLSANVHDPEDFTTPIVTQNAPEGMTLDHF